MDYHNKDKQYEYKDKQYELKKIQDNLTEVKSLTSNTIEKVLVRGENIDRLIDSTQELSDSSNKFLKQSRKLKSQMQYRKVRCILISLSIISLLIYLFAVAICGNFTLKHC